MNRLVKTAWFRQTTIRPGITQITEPHVHPYFRANIWLVVGREADLLVDFGMGLAPLAPVLQRDPAKPLIALATHAHVDHIGGFHEFTQRFGPAASAAAFADMPDTVTLAHIFRDLPDPLTQTPEAGWKPGPYCVKPAPLTRLLAEGDMVDIGTMFTVLELPGHSPDSMGLFDPVRGLLIAGDAIYDGQIVDDLPGSDPATYVRTMERLASLEIDLAITGHNMPLTQTRLREIAQNYIERH
ncbi:MBL fold metallo-hydrolase [Pseudotabrizicola sp. 4114]|uniref:MBL fold metallo-hydrolase n=1 Tax=Pseudotabrizicola sp. 4114 TaxID=2817731 RepID=UPI002866C5BE|nr:glyoxylase-like metal-dependent hydrolase (beta-lactamase superfamily II) [Pseudorhodobacter sp. 4114]